MATIANVREEFEKRFPKSLRHRLFLELQSALRLFELSLEWRDAEGSYELTTAECGEFREQMDELAFRCTAKR